MIQKERTFGTISVYHRRPKAQRCHRCRMPASDPVLLETREGRFVYHGHCANLTRMGLLL